MSVLEIANERIDGEEIDASKFEFIRIVESEIANLTVRGVSGKFNFGDGFKKSRFERCKILDGRISDLSLGLADFVDCEFVNCDIANIDSREANLLNCRFSGRIRKGIMFPRHGDAAEAHGPAIVDGNDFSECAIEESIFRGGIDLHRQKFKSDGSAILEDGAEFLRRAQEHFVNRKPTNALRVWMGFVEWYVTRYNQNTIFVPFEKMKAIGSEIAPFLDLYVAT